MPLPVPDTESKKLMVEYGLTLRTVAERAGVPYTKASEVLNGRRICAETLRSLRKAITQEARSRKTPAHATR
jgi:predicted transcriptional regulator